MTWWTMVRLPVALLAAMLALAGPASAQDPDPPGDPGAPPEDPSTPSEGDGSDAASDDETPSGDGSGEDPSVPPASGNEPSSTQATLTLSCRLAETNAFDPRSQPSQFVILDPDGCYKQLLYRLVGHPPIVGHILRML